MDCNYFVRNANLPFFRLIFFGGASSSINTIPETIREVPLVILKRYPVKFIGNKKCGVRIQGIRAGFVLAIAGKKYCHNQYYSQQ